MQATESPSTSQKVSYSEQRIARAMCAERFRCFLRYVITNDTQRGLGLLPLPDYPYLNQYADDLQDNRLTITLKSRQMMISWMAAAYLIWRGNFHTAVEALIMSINEDKAKELKSRAALIFHNLPDWMKAQEKETTLDMSWPKLNSRMKSLPCTPDNARSFSASDGILDEAAFLEHGSTLYAAIMPSLDAYGSLHLLSTPNGHDALFKQLWDDTKKPFKRITLHWREHPLRDDTWAALTKRACLNDQQWLREYELSFNVAAGKPVYEIFERTQVQECYNQWDVNKPVVVGVDRGYHHPALVYTQMNSYDQLLVFRTIQGQSIDKNKFLRESKQQMDTWFPNQYGKGSYRVLIPPDAKEKEADGSTWANSIREIWGINPQEPGNDDIKRRVDATRIQMRLRDDKRYGLLVDPFCQLLIDGLTGGYAYPEKINSPEDEKPAKDDVHDHLCNALEAICDQMGKIVKKPQPSRLSKPIYDKVTGRVIGYE
jgi:hypothetical protein